MQLFEKIFNYQVISRLEQSGAIALTSQERSWLKTMLKHPSAEDAFSPGTLGKLRDLLEREPDLEVGEVIVEKARSRERHVYHPLLRPLRRFIMRGESIRIVYRSKGGQIGREQTGFPYKLEYSMVKREWYLLWHNASRRPLLATKLENIISLSAAPNPARNAGQTRARIAAQLESGRDEAVIEIVQSYNAELSRILYAFSCFEKEVSYDEESDRYRIRLAFLGDEAEYVLSKLRFLGKRVRVVEGLPLQRRMAESAARALARYGEED